MSGPKDKGDRYLWESAGPAEPDIERLERVLKPLRYTQTAPEAVVASPWRRRTALAAAAVVVIGAGIVWLGLPGGHDTDGWEIASLTGTALIGKAAVAHGDRLTIGQWLETGEGGRVEVKVADIGTVTVHPGSRLRLRATQPDEHRLDLAHGHIEAFIIAPPRLFFVDTPSATAIDLGCAYELIVDKAGNGTVTVTLGRVEFERDGRSSRVPEGAECKTRRDIGPGTPYFTDASPGLIDALEQLDFGTPESDTLITVLAETRPKDTLTLWHLLARLEGSDRAAVLDRLVQLSPPPVAADLNAVRRGDKNAQELWWQDLERAW